MQKEQREERKKHAKDEWNGLERSDECLLPSEGMSVQQEDFITIDEVRNKTKEMKKRKSPGDDGITNGDYNS